MEMFHHLHKGCFYLLLATRISLDVGKKNMPITIT